MNESAFWGIFVVHAAVTVGMLRLVMRVVADLFEESDSNKEHTEHYGFSAKAVFVGGHRAIFRDLRNRHPKILGTFYVYCLVMTGILCVSAT